MTVEIGPANVRDLTFILGNLRKSDAEEIRAQMPDDMPFEALTAMCVQPGFSWVAYHNRMPGDGVPGNGVPVMAFGFMPLTMAGNVLQAWAFGTRRAAVALRPIARFAMRELVPEWRAAGVTRIEARSIVGHVSAHKWLRSLGCAADPLPGFGRGGQPFVLFSWLLDGPSLGLVDDFAN